MAVRDASETGPSGARDEGGPFFNPDRSTDGAALEVRFPVKDRAATQK
jgi:hypothetical protein